jgi:hypothetical protein
MSEAPGDPRSDDELMRQLETEDVLRPRSRWRTGPLIPLAGMALCAFFLAQSKAEILYLFSSSTPVDLGHPGAYDFSSAAEGAYAKISVQLEGDSARYQNGFDKGKVYPVAAAPLLIERRGTSDLRGAIEAEGELKMDRLLPPQYQPVIVSFLKGDRLSAPAKRFQTDHVWVLVDGHRPRSLDLKSAFVVLLLFVFLVNAYLLFRRPAG